MRTPTLLVAVSPLVMLLAAPLSASAAPSAGGPDFNGDGKADIAIGATDRVVVQYGGDAETEALHFTPAKGFGQFFAAGDFNADGYDDLAVSGIFARQGAGEVRVFYGHDFGLVAEGLEPQVLTQGGLAGRTTPGAHFGIVVAGDVTGDGIDDLAVGAPDHTRASAPESGIVTVVPGAEGAQLGSVPAVVVSQDSPGVTGTAEEGDSFGAGLAVGDVTGDGTGDLVIAASGENGRGMVHVLPGSAGGPTGTGSSAVAGTSIPGLAPTWYDGTPAALLGVSLAVADLTGDGKVDVAAGAPFARVGSADLSGGVAVLRGDGTGIAASRAQFVTQASSGVVGAAETSDQFGLALAVGNLDGTGKPELLVGTPGEAVGTGYGKGSYVVLHGASGGVTGSGSYAVSQDTANVPGTAEAGDFFALALDVQDLDGDGRDDVVVGVPGEDAGTVADAGTVSGLISDAQGRPAAGSSTLESSHDKDDSLGQTVVASAGFVAAGVTSTSAEGSAPSTARAGASSTRSLTAR